MTTITKEQLTASSDNPNAYQTTITVNGQFIDVSIDPDDVTLDDTLALVNKVIGDLQGYASKAVNILIQEYLATYNDNWREDDEPELDEERFAANLTLTSLLFLSDSSVDFVYAENGMFGHHSLIAQSFDGETFDDAMLYG
ncbi:MAG: DUF2262 domain-containing protein [Spirosomataceae bacterium]